MAASHFNMIQKTIYEISMNQSEAVLISSEKFRGHHYGSNHPLNIPRVPLTIDLIHCFKGLSSEQSIQARKATVDELTQFHDSAYIEALLQCEKKQRVSPETRQVFNLGNFENPYFQKMFTIPALATGGSIQGAQFVIKGSMAFNPAGGMHHAAAKKARGFCYLNDAVLSILTLQKAGMRVLYFDMDAHHGDGVEDAFDKDKNVLTVSFHMDTRYAYPRKGGQIENTGSCGTAVNLPLPKNLNDQEYRYAFNTLWPELLQSFQPDVVVLQAGTDILKNDPLGKFNISNHLFLEVISRVKRSAPKNSSGIPRLLVLGGGGYHPIILARCWTGVWGILSGKDFPSEIPEKGIVLLKSIYQSMTDKSLETMDDSLFKSLYDHPLNGPVRNEIKERVDRLLNTHPIFNAPGSR